jgi:hypothetical protein
VLLSYCLLRPTVLLWRRRRTSSFIVMRVKHSRHKNTPHLYQKNLPAISHHKSSRHFSPQTFPPFLTTNLPAISHHKPSRHFSPQTFPPFLTTNLPAISHHKPSRHFSPQTFPPFLTSHQPCASSSLPPQKYPALVPHRLSRHKNTPIFCLIVSPRHKNI